MREAFFSQSNYQRFGDFIHWCAIWRLTMVTSGQVLMKWKMFFVDRWQAYSWLICREVLESLEFIGQVEETGFEISEKAEQLKRMIPQCFQSFTWVY